MTNRPTLTFRRTLRRTSHPGNSHRSFLIHPITHNDNRFKTHCAQYGAMDYPLSITPVSAITHSLRARYILPYVIIHNAMPTYCPTLSVTTVSPTHLPSCLHALLLYKTLQNSYPSTLHGRHGCPHVNHRDAQNKTNASLPHTTR